ncbi:hypothetical protein COJ01_17645 [Priestia megaterium]|jgi:hypothetical protein|uniref:hypothetical protein n=1 Tax=Priestia megaterium TaxID=1404 RepID=UPI000BF6A6ED|nr:hypothetical protein [Priestia megaterium]PFK99886.1 hypothetical protein COJ01_17645 [Priestia megaterium]
MREYLIVTNEAYTDPTGFLGNPDGERDGEGWVELKNPKEVVLGTYMADSDEKAIKDAAAEWKVSKEVLSFYPLAKVY